MYKKIILSLFFLCAMSSFSVMAQEEANPWSLDSCISYARQHNNSILQAYLKTEEAKTNLREAKSALFPSLSLSSSQRVSFEKNAEKTAIYTGSYDLSSKLTLFEGGKNLNNIKQKKLDIQSTEFNSQYVANNIEIEIIKAYYQILYAHESVLTNTATVATSEQQLARSRELYASGKISKVDFAQVESQYQDDKYQLVVAQNEESKAKLSLKQILQFESDRPFEVLIPSSEVEPEFKLLPSLEDIKQAAYTSLPEIKQADTEIEISKLNEKIASGERMPTISLNAGIGTGHNNLAKTNIGTQFKNGLNEYVGISFNLPIFNNRQTKSKIERARIATKSAELSSDEIRLDISNHLAELHLEAESAQSRYAAATAKLQAAESSYELINQKYEMGMQNLVDLLVEKNNYLNAIQEKLQSKYTALLNIRLLEFYLNQASL